MKSEIKSSQSGPEVLPLNPATESAPVLAADADAIRNAAAPKAEPTQAPALPSLVEAMGYWARSRS